MKKQPLLDKAVSQFSSDMSQSNEFIAEPAQLPYVTVCPYDMKEETTRIDVAILITVNHLKRWVVVPLISILSLFVFPVFLYWKPKMQKDWLYSRASTVQAATHVYIEGRDGNIQIVRVYDLSEQSNRLIANAQQADPEAEGLSTFFTYRFINFEWKSERRVFEPVRFNCALPYDELRAKYTDERRIGNQDLRQLQLMKFGRCDVDVPKKSVIKILFDEVLNPFYIFQVFAVALWMWDNYYYYASCILVISTGSVLLGLYETIKNNNEIRNMARYSCPVRVKEQGEGSRQISSSELVPGDIVVVPEGLILPCDMVLLTGTAIVNEAMLTGESIPVMKSSLPVVSEEVYSDKNAEKHTLFGGTKVIQTRSVGDEPVWALVKNTGFLTTKGSLIRDILYPKEIKFKFYSDGFKFVGIMAVLALMGMAATVPLQVHLDVPLAIFIDRALDLLTVTVPPALPAAMSCGIVFAINRLKAQEIFCISPPRINMAGQISTFVFDKTGTLTEEGLSVLGVKPTQVQEAHPRILFTEFEKDASKLTPKKSTLRGENAAQARSLNSTLMVEAMASCTAVTYVNDELVGDPLDVQMFQATGWRLDEPNGKQDAEGLDHLVIAHVEPGNIKPKIPEIGCTDSDNEDKEQKRYRSALIRRFDFSSGLQRMSVICKNDFDSHYRAFVKGSPEKISELCLQETIPHDFQKVLTEYTREGYRVIALAVKDLPEMNYRKLQTISRSEVEQDLTFLGMLVMENKLKPVTTDVIKNLQDCKLRTIMATGDNVLTAISVAGQCGIIDRNKNVFLGDLVTDNQGLPQVVWSASNLSKKTNLTMQRSTMSAASSELSNQESDALPWDYRDENINVALTGKAFKHFCERQEQDPFTFLSVLRKAKVYARMSPDDKAFLVDNLQHHLAINCGMCGDGANDCGALKTAAVGISLSEAEASIAAPFTSKVQDIRCVVKLLIEGKAAMTTSFQAFKFIELYSVIQLVSCVMLYSIGSNITDTQFLYIDIVALVPLSIVQAMTGSYHKLTSDVPTATLFYLPVLTSVIVSSAIQLAFQLFYFLNIRNQPFYVPIDPETLDFDAPNPSYESTILFMVANFQYLITCISFSIAKPFRKPIWTNYPFFFCVVFLFVFSTVIVFLPSTSRVSTAFNMLPFSTDTETFYNYRFWIFLGIIVNSIVTYVAEKLIVGILTKRADRRLQEKKDQAFHQKIDQLRSAIVPNFNESRDDENVAMLIDAKK